MKHRDRQPPEENLSAGRVEYLEQARQRQRRRRIRRTAALVLLLTAVVAFATGLVGASVAKAKDLVDSISIALRPDAGWPQNTGIPELLQLEPLSGCFVELGEDACVVYSNTGSRLNFIQSGYARPALAAGRTRFVLYNRSGNELRVESRTQNLYTKTTENGLYLCAVAPDGKVATVTGEVRNVAELVVYSPTMTQQLSWGLTSAEGIPLRMEFAPDSRRLAVAAVTSRSGQMVTNLYLLPLNQGDPQLLASQQGLIQWMGWLSGDALCVVYSHSVVLYDAKGAERGRYDFPGQEMTAISQDAGGLGLLLRSGQLSAAVMLDRGLGVQYSGAVPASTGVLRAGQNFYLLTDSGVECFSLAGERLWGQQTPNRPQGLLPAKEGVLLLSGNSVQLLAPPQPEENT